MTNPPISVVIETITARLDTRGPALPDALAEAIRAIERQSYPGGRIETIIVVDEGVREQDIAEIRRRHPEVVLARSAVSNYFAAKNCGAKVASGDYVVFLDGDCVPEPDCLARLVARFEPDVAVVAGRVRYSGRSWPARIFSVPDFAYIVTEAGGEANGLNLSNAAFRREILVEQPLEERIRRNGGCYQLFHRIRRAGFRALYEPDAIAAHGVEVGGLGFLRKHYDRGFDGLAVYRLDDSGLFRGTPWVKRLGPVALAGLTGRRILLDWGRIVRHRRQMGVSTLAVPAYALVGAGLRLVELVGGTAAFLSRRAKAEVDRPAGSVGKAA